MSAEHTPGPWTIAAESGEWFPVLENYDPIPSTIENARLMAAAPDLLAALEAVVRIADRNTVEFIAARAAIAKAKGGAE